MKDMLSEVVSAPRRMVSVFVEVSSSQLVMPIVASIFDPGVHVFVTAIF